MFKREIGLIVEIIGICHSEDEGDLKYAYIPHFDTQASEKCWQRCEGAMKSSYESRENAHGEYLFIIPWDQF